MYECILRTSTNVKQTLKVKINFAQIDVQNNELLDSQNISET